MRIHLSVEKDTFAVQTLRLRAFLRSFETGFPKEYFESLNRGVQFPDWRELYPNNWRQACKEVQQLELGSPGVFEKIAGILDDIRRRHRGNTILVGGPPCQAYSLVGRSRNRGKKGYLPENDNRHFLYREYVRILDRLCPLAFLMENVKGMLSSKVNGGPIFERILEDLRSAGDGYHLLPLASPRVTIDEDSPASNFLVRAEQHRIPQARHRVFIVGLRRCRCAEIDSPRPLLEYSVPDLSRSVMAVIRDLPTLRSGLSRNDSPDSWAQTVHEQAKGLVDYQDTPNDIRDEIADLLRNGLATCRDRVGMSLKPHSQNMNRELSTWLNDRRLTRVIQHETRGHMPSDLGRYLFAATFARVRRKSPRLSEFPAILQPNHKNRYTNSFIDRFRVQLADRPSSTVTSHISKDGHYFIHPDPKQCRSLTVREVARLQTFPDNYMFCGPRTEQYKQVGNAVPPYLAKQVANAIRSLLKERSVNLR